MGGEQRGGGHEIRPSLIRLGEPADPSGGRRRQDRAGRGAPRGDQAVSRTRHRGGDNQAKRILLSVLEGAGVSVANPDEVSVLQYNSPLTLPWRRRNEIALVITEEERAAVGSSDDSDDSALEQWKARSSATSWYDAGVRL